MNIHKIPLYAKVALLCVVFLTARPPTTAAVNFSDYIALPTGSQLGAVAIADLNGDGKNDVVATANYNPNSIDDVLVFFQNAQRGLNDPIALSAGGRAQSVTVADFNGDGQKDIAVGAAVGVLNGWIRVFWNKLGDFGEYSDYNTTNSLTICSGDFNHDGLTDLAGISFSGSRVEVLTQSTAGLRFAATYPVSYGGVNDLKASDVNADGWCDIVVLSGQDGTIPNVSILMQSETGFAPAAPCIVANQLTRSVAIGDITGDGRAEVLATYGGIGPLAKIAVFTQKPEGMFALTTNYTSYDTPGSIAIADLDMDGRLDAVVLHNGTSKAGVYLQNQSGGLADEQLFTDSPYAVNYYPQGLAIGDINSDGRPDIVVAANGIGLVVLYNASPAPPFRISAIQRLSNGTVTLSVPYLGPNGSCTVERADALGNWKDVGTVSDFNWSDREPSSEPARFYRLRAN